MAGYLSHLDKAKENLELLQFLEVNRGNDLDWKVTLCFYTALHLMNAYLAKEKNWHYRTHKKVNDVLNPFNDDSELRLDNDTYTSYEQLYKLSRRARYLCNPDETENGIAHYIQDKHHKKAIKHLDKVIIFFSKKYTEEFNKYFINNIYFKNNSETKYLVHLD